MWIVRLALSRPYTFVVASLVMLLLAPLVLLRTPTDIFPAINIPVISVVWQYSGDYTAHPTTGSWMAGAHVLVNPAATNGQWKRSECVQSGTYGTSTPPLWQDFDVVNTSTATP